MKIWLGNLGCYNEGELYGEWLTLPMSEEDLSAAIRKICVVFEDDREDEYFIADWECVIEGIVSEYANVRELNEIAKDIESLSECDVEKLRYLIEEESYEYFQAIEKLDNVELWDGSLKDVAYELVEMGCIKIENYIDYDAIARDLGFDGYQEVNGSVFRLCH